MIIIFEGPDNSGKTTIAKELATCISFAYFKMNTVNSKNVNKANLSEIHETVEQYSLSMLKNIEMQFGSKYLELIIDRHYPSDYVYNKIYKRNRSMKSLKASDEMFCSLHEHLIVICYKTEFEQKKGDFAKVETYAEAAKLYKQFAMKFTKANCLLIDTTDQDIDKQIHILIDTIASVRERGEIGTVTA